ncbi:hypothetical protein [Ruegeria arenilitoris]|uniref:hypothetical protein n=1 Tax=Ruegeria arenilitoris TaxID=1173585 RepID=UPI00147ED67B|nr:hypothetical protein [Ruegeria arenilitoris]
MTGIFRYKLGQPVTWYDRRKKRSNQYCLYCQRFIGEGSEIPSNKEHLIGKNFVPGGSFDNGRAFNFVFRACEQCNTDKSRLEDHVSATTLISSPGRGMDEKVDDLARRKSNSSYHPTQKSMKLADSNESVTLNFGDFSFGLVAPPQTNERYRNRLALLQVQGLYALITSSDPTNKLSVGLLPSENCWVLGCYPRSDWGNSQLIEVTRRCEKWPCYANISTANGYFKALMKREAPDNEWFWALEWNKSTRVIGCLAPPGELPRLFQGLPELEWKVVTSEGSVTHRYREETPLPEDQDTLFSAQVHDCA